MVHFENKLHVIAVLILVSSLSEIGAQSPDYWTSTSTPYFRHINRVYIAENTRFFAVGGNESNDPISTVCYSDDTCQTWYVSLDEVNAWLKDLSFPGLQSGYAVGHAGTVYKTTDGGGHWSPLTVNGNAGTRNYNAVHFFDDQNGIIAGGNETNDAIQTIIKTSDGGDSWSVIYDNLNPWILDIHFVDDNLGFAVGDQGTILKTTDGGDHWDILAAPGNCAQRKLNSVRFLSDQVGIIVGGNPQNDSIQTIIKTVDGGTSWSIIRDNIAPMLNSVHFYSLTEGYAVGDWGEFLYTDDQGETWVALDIPENDDRRINDIFFLNNTLGIAGGNHGKILYYNNVSGSVPDITIDPVAKISGAETVRISGEVNPNGEPTLVEFEYSTDMSFDLSVHVSADDYTGSTSRKLSLYVDGLQGNTGYHGRLKASNVYGVNYSEVILFHAGLETVPNFDFENWELLTDFTLNDWDSFGKITRVDSYNGTYAVQLRSKEESPGMIFIADIDPGVPISGGLPYSSRPDSLGLWCDYDISDGDTALVVLQLKAEGEHVADTIYKITGTSGEEFQYLKYGIHYTGSGTPDTLILIISNTDGRTGKYDPHSILAVDDISFSNSEEPVPNQDMESWTEENRYKAPGWSSVDDFNPGYPFLVDRTSEAYAGEYALKLSNRQEEDQVRFGRVYTGDNIESDRPAFPVYFRHEICYGFYKFYPDHNDSLFLTVNFYKNGQVIGFSREVVSEAAPDYQMFSFEISYAEEEIPDSASIEIAIGNDRYTPGSSNSYAVIDNITFDGIMASVENDQIGYERNDISIRLFPNPVSDVLHIEIEGGIPDRYEIYITDLMGKIHLHKPFAGMNNKERAELDLSMLPCQFYILTIRTGNHLYSRKIVKQ